jgi:hypothetical protein
MGTVLVAFHHGGGGWIGRGHDDIHTSLNQLGGKLGDSRQLGIIGVPMHEDDVVPGDIAQ